ncbi:MAG: hypothetical protein A2145_00575 [candidate division Zixibacteria bacterium RBG_16_40_9]|nr:MAG: hypothetical protein A2145_00575 [candidate division Zixibacteria bacterium RBG_16_40_9]
MIVKPFSVIAADLDRDGDQDLVASAAGFGGHDSVSVFKNNGDGTFAAKIEYQTGSGAGSVFASDLDGDEDIDLAVADSSSTSVYVLKNNGDGTFATKVGYRTGRSPMSVFATDLDGDGDKDLAVANIGLSGASGTVSILKNSGDGTFAERVDYGTGLGPVFIFASDLNGDGKEDLAVANTGGNSISILKNLSIVTCTFKPGDVNGDMKYNLIDIVSLVNVIFKGGAKPNPACRADANSDGQGNLVDIIFLVNTIFKGGPNPLPIGPCCL